MVLVKIRKLVAKNKELGEDGNITDKSVLNNKISKA